MSLQNATIPCTIADDFAKESTDRRIALLKGWSAFERELAF